MDCRVIPNEDMPDEKTLRRLAALCAVRIFDRWDDIEESACRQGQFEQDHRVQTLAWVSEIRDKILEVFKEQGLLNEH